MRRYAFYVFHLKLKYTNTPPLISAKTTIIFHCSTLTNSVNYFFPRVAWSEGEDAGD